MLRIFSCIYILVLWNSNFVKAQQTDIQKIQNNKVLFDSLIKNVAYADIPELLKRTMSLSDKIDSDSIYAKVHAMHAQYYEYTGNYEKTAIHLIEAARRYKLLGNTKRYLMMNNNLAGVLYQNKQYDKVLKIRQEILQDAYQEEDHFLIAMTLINLVSVYRNLDLLDSSLFYIDEGLNYAKKYEFESLIGSGYSIKQNLYYDLKHYEQSLLIGDTIAMLYKNNSARGFYEHSLIYSANSLNVLGEYKLALSKSKLALELFKQKRIKELMPDIYNAMASSYEGLGDYKNAHIALGNELKIKDELMDLNKQKAIIALEKRFQNERKEKENIQLKQESAQKDLIIANKNNTLLIGFLSFIFTLSILAAYLLRKAKKVNKQLQKSMFIQKNLEGELVTVRNNIAQDFHDDLGNKLARISIFSQLLSNQLDDNHDQNKSMLNQIVDDADYLYKGTRDFVFSIKAESDYVEELVTYLSDFGESYFKEFDIEFEIIKQIDKNEKLPYYWSKQLIYIFKEAMTNVVKHANATNVTMSFIYSNKILEIKCVDNGKGPITKKKEASNGIINMKERALRINADLNIYSDIEGFTVSFIGNTNTKN